MYKKVKKYLPERMQNFLFQIKSILNAIVHSSPLSNKLYIKYKKSNVVYLIVPKTGNSTINAMFLEKETGFSSTQDYRDIHREKEKFSIRKLSVPFLREYRKIAIVRNPYDRILSCYKNKLLDEKKFVKFNYFGMFKKGMSFQEFVETCSKLPDSIAEMHIKSQYSILTLFDRKLYDDLYFYENFPHVEDELSGSYQLKKQAAQNVSKNTKKKNYFDKQTADIIYKRYKKDFECFGYNKNSWKQL